MGTLKHKIWRDLWKNKGRTLQIVLIIAMGAASLGMIISVRSLMIPAMQDGWQAINPAMMNFGVFPGLDEDDLIAISKIDGVTEVDGLLNAGIEWRTSPEDEWTPGQLMARSDYNNQKLNRLELGEGNWPHNRIFAVETGHESHFNVLDRKLSIRVNEREHEVQLDGIVYNQLSNPVSFGGNMQLYTTRDRFDELTGARDFTQLMVNAAKYDEEAVTALADKIQERLEKQGKTVYFVFPGRVTDPNKHFFQDSMDGLFFLMGAMGLLALVLGLLLVYNTINAIISQQVEQIGIMKAIGATTGRILLFYLSNTLIYGLLALALALPMGVFGGWAITSWLVRSFNAEPGSFTMSPLAVGVMVLISLLAPLLASLIPIFSGARITVREAISTYGLSTGGSLLDRLLSKTKRISRMILLTISNTFRNKWRVALLQITLVFSGLIFMMVVSMRDSVVYTFDDILFSILNYDINYIFEDAERINHIEALTLAHPEVKAVEMWDFSGGTLRPQSQAATDDDESATCFGVPLPTELYGQQMRAGRWLDPSDTYAVVLNQKLAKDAGVTVGDWVVFKQNNDRESTWQVVGLLADPLITNSVHAPRKTLLKETRNAGKAYTVWIQTESSRDNVEIAKDLRNYYEQNQVKLSPQRGVFGMADTSTETGQAIINQFNFIVVLLGIMAVIIGAVGSIALSGALSLSVLERRREIGVMRAIGASSWDISRLFIGEGLLLGWLSWALALPFIAPAGKLLLKAIGSAFDLDLVYNYTLTGAILWFVIITILSILASFLPARGATRVSVRESLAYQ